MAERAWTKGPWVVGLRQNAGDALVYGTTGRHHDVIAQTYGRPAAGEQTANVSLIAAAPDLYEALDAIEQHLISGCKDVLEGRRIRECARAALAKAEAKDEG